MKKFITLVLRYETEEEFQKIRKISMGESCRAWSMDHELLRVDLLRQAIDDGDLRKADEYLGFDGVFELRNEVRGR